MRDDAVAVRSSRCKESCLIGETSLGTEWKGMQKVILVLEIKRVDWKRPFSASFTKINKSYRSIVLDGSWVKRPFLQEGFDVSDSKKNVPEPGKLPTSPGSLYEQDEASDAL